MSSVLFILALISFFSYSAVTGGVLLAVGFIISPYGLPKLAEWLLDMLGNFNGVLKNFIMG